MLPMVRRGTFAVRVDALDDFKNAISKMQFQKYNFKNTISKMQFQKYECNKFDNQVIASMIAVCEFTWRRRKLAVDEDVRRLLKPPILFTFNTHFF